MTRLTSLLSFIALFAATTALAGTARYAGFDVTSREDPAVTFHFSDADATSASPVVITIPGRKLTNDDRTYRVSLQKHWLSLNVPKGFRFVARVLGKCELKREGEFPFCDIYSFEDPDTKKQTDYYIYVGNWP